jgi:hypothetical protein
LHEEMTICKAKDENHPSGDAAGQAREAYDMSECYCHPASEY